MSQVLCLSEHDISYQYPMLLPTGRFSTYDTTCRVAFKRVLAFLLAASMRPYHECVNENLLHGTMAYRIASPGIKPAALDRKCVTPYLVSSDPISRMANEVESEGTQPESTGSLWGLSKGGKSGNWETRQEECQRMVEASFIKYTK